MDRSLKGRVPMYGKRLDSIRELVDAQAPAQARLRQPIGGGLMESTATVPAPQRRSTILIADDDPSLLALCADLLRRNSFTVITASDGAQALNMVKRHGSAIDLLVTDFEMPH